MMEDKLQIQERVQFKTIKEEWSEYRLKDDTVIKVKPIVVDILKTDKKDQFGFPVYIVKSVAVTMVQSPVGVENDDVADR